MGADDCIGRSPCWYDIGTFSFSVGAAAHFYGDVTRRFIATVFCQTAPKIPHAIHPDDFDRINETFAQSMVSGRVYRGDVRLKSKTGEYRWHSVVGEPVLNDEHKIVKWVGAFTDRYPYILSTGRRQIRLFLFRPSPTPGAAALRRASGTVLRFAGFVLPPSFAR